MTRMADDFERADHERDLRKHDIPLEDSMHEGWEEFSSSRTESDLLLVALIVFGILIPILTVILMLIMHAAHL